MIGDFAEGDGPAEFASPACFIHEVDPSYSGLGATPPELQRSAISRWRKSERQRLIVQRLGISSRDGIRCAGDIAAQLDALLPGPHKHCRQSLSAVLRRTRPQELGGFDSGARRRFLPKKCSADLS